MIALLIAIVCVSFGGGLMFGFVFAMLLGARGYKQDTKIHGTWTQ